MVVKIVNTDDEEKPQEAWAKLTFSPFLAIAIAHWAMARKGEKVSIYSNVRVAFMFLTFPEFL